MFLQVLVYVNGIPTKCDGTCDFEWTTSSTPVMTSAVPTQGNSLHFIYNIKMYKVTIIVSFIKSVKDISFVMINLSVVKNRNKKKVLDVYCHVLTTLPYIQKHFLV